MTTPIKSKVTVHLPLDAPDVIITTQFASWDEGDLELFNEYHTEDGGTQRFYVAVFPKGFWTYFTSEIVEADEQILIQLTAEQ